MSANLPPSSRTFTFLREIAAGGFGSVYLAKIEHGDGFSRLAAVKLLHRKWSEHEEIVKRMRDEARLLGWLRHRNIVDVLDLTMIDGRCAVVMEYLEAVDLKLIIRSLKHHKTHLPMRVGYEIASCVAAALDAAYNRPPYAGEKPLRVIHRDIKPSNVMIDDAGTPKVLDFGVARADFATRESKTQELSFGSVDYMPPERLFFEPETAASDVYSLAATLYELLVLERLGKAKLSRDAQDEHVAKKLRSVDECYPGVPADEREAFADLLFEMLSFEPSERPMATDVSERLRALARRRSGEPSLPEWSEKNIPPLVAAFQRARDKAEPDPLLHSTLNEDSRPFVRPGADSSEPLVTDEAPEDVVDFAAPTDPVALPDDDDRWNKLKEATLAEIRPDISGRQPLTTPDSTSSLGFMDAFTASDSGDESPTMAFSDIDAFTDWEEDEQPTVVLAQSDLGLSAVLEDDEDDFEDEPTNEVPKESTGSTAGPGATRQPLPAPPPPPPGLRGRSLPLGGSQPGLGQTPVVSASPPLPSPAKQVPAEDMPPTVPPHGAVKVPVSALNQDTMDTMDTSANVVSHKSVVMLLAGVVVVFLVLLGAGGAAFLYIQNMEEGALDGVEAPEDAVDVEPAPEVPSIPPAVEEAPLAPGEARFTVNHSAPKKLVVSCGEDSVSGVTAARLTASLEAMCSVKFIASDRSRNTTKVKFFPGEWTCFADGSDDCVNPDVPIEVDDPTNADGEQAEP